MNPIILYIGVVIMGIILFFIGLKLGDHKS